MVGVDKEGVRIAKASLNFSRADSAYDLIQVKKPKHVSFTFYTIVLNLVIYKVTFRGDIIIHRIPCQNVNASTSIHVTTIRSSHSRLHSFPTWPVCFQVAQLDALRTLFRALLQRLRPIHFLPSLDRQIRMQPLRTTLRMVLSRRLVGRPPLPLLVGVPCGGPRGARGGS